MSSINSELKYCQLPNLAKRLLNYTGHGTIWSSEEGKRSQTDTKPDSTIIHFKFSKSSAFNDKAKISTQEITTAIDNNNDSCSNLDVWNPDPNSALVNAVNSDSSCSKSILPMVNMKTKESETVCQWSNNTDENKPKVVVEVTPSGSNYLSEISALRDSDEEKDGLRFHDYEPKSYAYSGNFTKKIQVQKKPLLCGGNLTKTSNQNNTLPIKNPLKTYSPKKIKSFYESKSLCTSRTQLNFPILSGSGECLEDIPWIAEKIKEANSEVTLIIHRLLFNIPGCCVNEWTERQTKKNILKFSGFKFSRVSNNFSWRKSRLLRLDINMLQHISFIFLGKRFHGKNDSIGKILSFLMKPNKRFAATKLKVGKSLKNCTRKLDADREYVRKYYPICRERRTRKRNCSKSIVTDVEVKDPNHKLKLQMLEGKAPKLQVDVCRLSTDELNFYMPEVTTTNTEGETSTHMRPESPNVNYMSPCLGENSTKYPECLFSQNDDSCGSTQVEDLNPQDDDSEKRANGNKKNSLESNEDVRFRIQCCAPEDLIELHDILYANSCGSWEIHKRILDFTGFTFSEDSMEFNLCKTLMRYMSMDAIKRIAKLLCLLNSYDTRPKDELIISVMNFLISLGQNQALASSPGTINKVHIIRIQNSEICNDTSREMISSMDQDESNDPQNYSLSQSCTKTFTESLPSSSDDESFSVLPMVAFSGHPSDGQLKGDIKKTIRENFLTMSMKGLVDTIYAKYSGLDLRYRSKFIKSRARKIFSTLKRQPFGHNFAAYPPVQLTIQMNHDSHRLDSILS